MQGACGTLDGILVELGGTFHRDDDGIHAGALCRAGDGPDVAHIRHLVEDEQKRHLTLLEQVGQDGVNIVVLDGRHEGDHTLMVATGEAIQLLGRHILEGDLALAHLDKEIFEERTAQILLKQHFVDGLSCGNSL